MIGKILRAARRYESQGDFDESTKLYNKALSLDSTSETAKRGLARIKAKKTNKRPAIGPGEMIRRMLRDSEKLTNNQRYWVMAIKATSDRFYRINFTPKQRRAIEDIYSQFLKKFELEAKGST